MNCGPFGPAIPEYCSHVAGATHLSLHGWPSFERSSAGVSGLGAGGVGGVSDAGAFEPQAVSAATTKAKLIEMRCMATF